MQQSDTIEDYEIWLAECKVERIAELRLLLERHGFTCDYHPSTDRFTISSSTESIMRQVDVYANQSANRRPSYAQETGLKIRGRITSR